MKKISFALLTVLLVGLVAGQAAAAAPVPEVRIQLWPEYSNSRALFMETVTYPEGTPLPIEVKMVIPQGAPVVWAGEVLGGDPSKDIQATPKVNKLNGYDEVVFTLSKSRVGQVEVEWDAIKVDGKKRTLVLDWVQRYEASSTVVGFKPPSGSSEITATPAAKLAGKADDNFDVYELSTEKLAVGESRKFIIGYSRNANASSAASQPDVGRASGFSNTETGIVVAMLVILAGVVAYAVYRKRAS